MISDSTAMTTSSDPSFADGLDDDSVLRALQALGQACLAPAAEQLASLTSPSLSYGHTDGRVQTQDEFIAALVNAQSVFRGIELRDVSVQRAGHLALVRHQAIYNTFNGGEAGVSDVQVCQIWLYAKNAWRLVLRQASKTLP